MDDNHDFDMDVLSLLPFGGDSGCGVPLKLMVQDLGCVSQREVTMSLHRLRKTFSGIRTANLRGDRVAYCSACAAPTVRRACRDYQRRKDEIAKLPQLIG